MMQFYKSQWEAQQQTTQRLVRENKKLKREYDHSVVARNNLAERIVDLQVDLGDLQDVNAWITGEFQSTKTQLKTAEEQIETYRFQLALAHWDNDFVNTNPIEDDQETEPESEIDV